MSIDRSFIKRFISLTIPFSLQLLISSAVNLADVMMIGRLGDAQIAAAGAANQLFFLLTIIQFGIGSGGSVFIAQYWGAMEKDKVKKVLGLMYLVSGAAPVLYNEIIWSVGTSLYMVAFGRMGTSAVAAVQIATAIAQILFVFVRGAGNAASIMLGNTIGEGREEDAFRDSRRFLMLVPLLSVVVSILLVLGRPYLLLLYDVSAEAEKMVSLLINLHALFFIPKAFSVVMIVGILRSGGRYGSGSCRKAE